MPQSSRTTSQRLPIAPPNAKQLKQQWNQQICATTGNVHFDAALLNCTIR
jgi:hypothetical protein